MVVLRVVPTGAQFGFARSLLFLGASDALLDGTRGLAAIVAGRTASLRVGGQGGREQDEEQGNLSEAHIQVDRYSGELKSIVQRI